MHRCITIHTLGNFFSLDSRGRHLFRSYTENVCFFRASVEIFRAYAARNWSIQAHFAYALTLKPTGVRDRYFPTTYAHATWQRLAPFFRLPGRVIRGSATVQVELRPFNDRQLNRDLAEVCARVNQLQPALPDGRRLVLSVDGMTLSPASRGSSTASMRSPEMRELTVLDPPHFPSPRLM